MELRCLLSRSTPPLSCGYLPSRSINTHAAERRKFVDESESSLRWVDRRLDSTIEGLRPKLAESCSHCVLTGNSETETQGRRPFRDGDRNLNLINVEESKDGFVLFKFGTADFSGDSPMFVPSSEHNRKASAASSLSEYLSDTTVSRNVDASRKLSSNGLGSSTFETAYNESNLGRDVTSVPKEQVFEGHFLEHPNNGSSFVPICTVGNTFEEAFVKIPNVDIPESKMESCEMLKFPPIFTEIPPQVISPSCLSPEDVGNGTITSVGQDGFHFKSPHGVEVHITGESVCEGVDPAIMTVENREPQMCCNYEDAVMGNSKLSSHGACLPKATTTKRVQKTKKKCGSSQKKSGKVVTRGIYRRGSLQLYEIILSYPFTKSSEALLNFQTVPKEEFGGLFNIFNHIAVGLAGSGLALVLFVASRMLSLNATLDSSKLMYLLRGIGLLWLSTALHKCGGAVKCMADVCTEARTQRKERLAMFRREVQAVTFKACAVAVLSMVRFV